MNVKRRVPSVNLGQRKLPSGRTQLFLDITIDGQRKRESMNLYLEPGASRDIKAKNKETLMLAEEIAEKRRQQERDISNGLDVVRNGGDMPFFEFYRSCIEKKDGSKNTWQSTLTHLLGYEKNELISFNRANKRWVEGFRNYLINAATKHVTSHHKDIDTGKPLKATTANSMLVTLSAAFNMAIAEGIITRNPCKGVGMIKTDSPIKQYLTADELRLLLNTPLPKINRWGERNWSPECLKSAFIFSSMTGLRISDICSIKWKNIVKSEVGRTRIEFRQTKTKQWISMDLNSVAESQLGERKDDEEYIYPINSSCANYYINRWIKAAGIKKHITFHSARHTNAVLLLSSGADIFTVQKMLGHKSINSTMSYAKIVDETKTKATDRLAALL